MYFIMFGRGKKGESDGEGEGVRGRGGRRGKEREKVEGGGGERKINGD